ncbi:MAG: PAS domain S-box protein, partial [Rivularia sp. (in: cyanobacteria)]
MKSKQNSRVGEDVFVGNSEMAGLMRDFDWEQTSLGAVETWSQSLKITLSILLTSRQPMLLFWGEELIQFYNDAYRPSLGADKHPQGLGSRARDFWNEIWEDVVEPQINAAMKRGVSTWNENQLVPMIRNGCLEEVYWTYGYSPVRDENGNINGALVVCTETTAQVIGERQLRTQRELASGAVGVKTVEQACEISARTLANNSDDVPFALLYLLDDTRSKAHLAGISGLDALKSVSPHEIEINSDSEICNFWSLRDVIATGKSQIVEGLQSNEELSGARSHSPNAAAVIPLIAPGQAQIKGFLIAGISPIRPFDDNYKGFFDLISGQIASAISNARAWETERKLDQIRETARRETEAANMRMQDVLSSIRDGFVIFDYNWRLTYLNNRELEIIGRSREDVLGNNLWELFPDLIGSEFERCARKVMLERSPMELEFYYPSLNGWFEIKMYPTSEGIASITADITERKQATSALRESEARFRQMAETIENVFWLFDLQARQHLYISPAYEKIWGRSCESVFADLSNWVETVHPEDRHQLQDIWERCIKNGSQEEEYRIIRPDGSIRWVRDRGFVVNDENGQPFRLAGVSEDITERKKASEALREQEARLQFMLECSQIGEWDLDLTTEPYTAHRSLKHDQIFGYESPLPEWSYEIFLSHVHPDEREYVDRSFKRTLSSYVDWDFECRIIRTDEKITWIWARGSVYRDSNGNPMRLIGSVTDINQRKQADEQLRESERRLRRLVESNMFGVVLGDSFGGLHYANDYLLNIIGYTSAEIDNGEVRWDELTPPEFAALDDKAIEEVSTKGVCTPYEKEFRHKDGRRIPILIGAALLNEPFNKNQEIVAFVLDLTQLKQVIQERDRFFNLSLDIMTIANLEGYFTSVNPALERTLGLTSAEITTKPYLDFVHPDDIAATVAEAQKLSQGFNTIGFENRYRCKDGSYHWFSWNVSAFPEQQVFYCVARDVTAQKQTELALRESELNFRTLANSMPQIVWTARPDGFLDYYNQRWFDYTGMTLEQTQGWGWEPVLHPEDVQMCVDVWSESVRTGNEYSIEYRFRRAKDGEYRWFLGRAIPLRNENGQIVKWFGSCTDIHDQKCAQEAAEQANRIKDEFLAVLSHELRTPLNPILGWAKILQKGNLNPKKTEIALETIERNAKLQTQLIDDLLDISRILQGKLRLNEASVNLATVIQSALETVRLAAEAKSIHIHTAKASEVGIVNGDEGRLQQVIWNMLSNAVKFTPKGGHIWITLTQVENYAQIQIKDTGKGIKKEFLPYLFEHFRQEDSATTRKFGGLGLGLAIVRQLVELHGGTVTADSAGVGQGAIFTVEIPTQSAINSTELLPETDRTSSNLNGINILVVDDEVDSCELIAFLLEQEGATVTTAASASEALESIAKSTPDLLISDIGMPDMDGYELIETIRASEKGKSIPAIAVTAYA